MANHAGAASWQWLAMDKSCNAAYNNIDVAGGAMHVLGAPRDCL